MIPKIVKMDVYPVAGHDSMELNLSGATTTMLSTKYNRDPEFATKLVVFTTLCSIPAIFLWSIVLI